MTSRTRPLLLVVSNLSRSSREPFVVAATKQYRLWELTGGEGRPSEPPWETPCLEGYTTVDTLDVAASVRAAQEVNRTTRVAGVFCCDEARVVVAAHVAEALGLPTSPHEAVARCRDKHLTRTALDAHDVPQARSEAVRTVEDAHAAAERIGYPVVVKPRNQTCSYGVARVDDAAELAKAFEHAASRPWAELRDEHEELVLVEEFLDGPEISIDAVVFEGDVEVTVVARKQTGFAPNFEETGHIVDARDPMAGEPELHDIVASAHAALGLHTGATHTELRLTSDGYKVVEVNARMGGDLIPYLGQIATGVEPNLAAASVACGERPTVERSASAVAGTRFYYPERDLVVREVRIDPTRLPPRTRRAQVLAEPGQHLQLPPRGIAWQSRLAQIVVESDDVAGCTAALDVAAQAVTAID